MSVASPVIDYLDPVNRRIYLLAGIDEYHPVEDIYKEVRDRRRNDESLRPYDVFVTAGGNLPKNVAGTERTPRYAIFWNTKIVLSGDTYISGEQLYSDGVYPNGDLVGKGNDCIDRALSPPDAYAEYAPPEAEVIVVNGSGGSVYTPNEIADAAWAALKNQYSDEDTMGGHLVHAVLTELSFLGNR
jgi:hypothetical protein